MNSGFWTRQITNFRWRIIHRERIDERKRTMNEKQKKIISDLRLEGFDYGKIADLTGINRNTIKSYCRRHGVEKDSGVSLPEGMTYCKNCRTLIVQNPKRKKKVFCCDKCRMEWWKNHPKRLNRKAVYEYICPKCRNIFTAYGNAGRKYCSHECYIKHRFEADTLMFK